MKNDRLKNFVQKNKWRLLDGFVFAFSSFIIMTVCDYMIVDKKMTVMITICINVVLFLIIDSISYFIVAYVKAKKNNISFDEAYNEIINEYLQEYFDD